MKKTLVLILTLIVLTMGVFLIACDELTPPNNDGGGNDAEQGGSNEGDENENTPSTYTITFKADGVTVETIEFTAETTSVTVPAVPTKTCFNGAWESFVLGTENLTVNAVYTPAHTALTKVDALEPQCNKTGNIEYWSCSKCNKSFTDANANYVTNNVTINKVACSYVDCICKWCGGKNHSLTHHARVEAQCNKTGNIEYWSCSKCEKSFTDANANNVTNNVTINKVACSYVNCICKWCGGKNHSLTHHARVEAQCNKTGNIEYWSCSKCNKNFTDANANNVTTNVVLGKVDCSYVDCICKWCGGKNHSLTHHARVESQCNKTGNIEYWYCSECEKSFIDANANNVTTNVTLNKISCSYVDCVCKWCGATNHSFTSKTTTSTYLKSAATCTEAAMYYYKCANCTAKGTETYSYGNANGHSFTSKTTTSTYLKSATTCTEAAVYYYKCANCNEKGTNTYTYGNANGHSYVNGTCTVCGGKQPPLYVRCDADGTANESGEYIKFGEYPQTIKAADVTITSSTDSRGYYLGSDGAYYAKVTAAPHGSGYKFSNGSSVTGGTVYYFKVEPILWRIIPQSNDTAMIVCDSIIANKTFSSSSNNYKKSYIRAWLNDQFYNTAFTALERELILTTTVDNSVASTGDSSNPYVCENTSDKIFLLSYAEVKNSAYGFSSNASRQMQPSDYSMATGANIYNNSSYYGYGDWWLRSPYYSDSDGALLVSYDGYVRYYGINYGGFVNSPLGVVPALQIRL